MHKELGAGCAAPHPHPHPLPWLWALSALGSHAGQESGLRQVAWRPIPHLPCRM